MKVLLSLNEKTLVKYFYLTVPLFFGLLALALGQDTNWDMRNYHYYNPYAFLNDRMDIDGAPAQLQSFYNPALHVPFYYAVTYLPARLVGFLLGAIQGINCLLLFAIARHCLSTSPGIGRFFVCLAISLTGFLGAGNLSELGTMMGDNTLSLTVLGSLLIVLRGSGFVADTGWRQTALNVLMAGVLVGVGVGLKLTFAIFAVGLCAAFFVAPISWSARWRMAFVFGGGVLIGIALSGGYWFYELWERFENPFFPYFNNIFKSPMLAEGSWRDTHLVPMTWVESLFFPFIFSAFPDQTAELIFRDLRMAILWFLVLALVLQRVDILLSPPSLTRYQGIKHWSFPRRYLLIAMLISYLVWLKLFGIYRYLIPIEIMAPLLIWIILEQMMSTTRASTIVSLACFLFILMNLVPINWGRAQWADEYFSITPPYISNPDQALILMTGGESTSYVVPLISEHIPFLRIESNFVRPQDDSGLYGSLLRERVLRHQGDLYALFASTEKDSTLAALQTYNLTFSATDCQNLEPHIGAKPFDPISFCQVSRVK